MSDMFESLELNMREEADRVNPTKAIMASQLECEKRFEGFVAKNPERIDFIADDIRSVADKYAAQYDISSDVVYDATVSHLKQAAVKRSKTPVGFEYTDKILCPDCAIRTKGDVRPLYSKEDLADTYGGEGPYRCDSCNQELDAGEDLKQAAVKQADDSMNYHLSDGLSNIIQDYVGYNHDLDGIEHYWNQYKPKVESLLKGNNQGVDYQRQLETEIEHLKNELDGVDSEEEGSERYWALEEEISNALSALYNLGVDHDMESAGIRNASTKSEKPWEKEDAEEDESEEHEESESPEEEKEEHEKESSVKLANINWEDLGDRNYRANGPHGEWNIEPQSREDQLAMGLDDWDTLDEEPRQNRYQLSHIPHGGNLAHDVRDTHSSLPEAFEAARQYQSDWNNRDKRKASVADQRLAAFLTAHQYVLFPELTKLGLTWQDLLQRSNLYGNKINPENVSGWGTQKAQQEKPKAPAQTGDGRDEMQLIGLGDQPTIEMPAQRAPAAPISPEDYTDRLMTTDELDAANNEMEIRQKRQRMGLDPALEGPEMVGGRGRHRGEYLRGASVLKDALVNYYVSTGVPQRTASILVEAVGEMAQLQQDNPGLPIADSEPKSINPDTAIGGKEGDKYQNWDVADKQKWDQGEGVKHQDFTDFGEPTREFIQPGGEAPYSENTKKDIFEGAEQSKMDAKRVKQDDNAPKKSSVKSSNMSVEEIKARIKELEGYTKRDLSAGEAFGPDHGQDDAADDELHDLKQLLKEKTENAPKTSAPLKDPAMEFQRMGDFLYGSTRDGMQAMVLDKNGRILKEFHGETAWMDAERYANDLFFEQKRNQKDPHLWGN